MLTLYDFGNSVCCQKVRIVLTEKDHALRPGMMVEVDIGLRNH